MGLVGATDELQAFCIFHQRAQSTSSISSVRETSSSLKANRGGEQQDVIQTGATTAAFGSAYAEFERTKVIVSV
jgi:hypothetical protein